LAGKSETLTRKEAVSGNNEYMSRGNGEKQCLLNAPFHEAQNFDSPEAHGKTHHIQFRISPFAQKIGEEVAALFGMSLSQYAKAVLYLNLGLVFEPLDRRRKQKPRKHKVITWEREEEF
jgi:hypothetical protein